MAETPSAAEKDTYCVAETVGINIDAECAEGQISTDEASETGQKDSKLQGARSDLLVAARSHEDASSRRASDGGIVRTGTQDVAVKIGESGTGFGSTPEQGGERVNGKDIDAGAQNGTKEDLNDTKPDGLSQAKPPRKEPPLCNASRKKSGRGTRLLDLTAASMQESFSAPCPADLRRLKRMPPLPKFKVKKRETEEDPDWVSVQYRVRTALTVDDVEYVRANDEYNQAIYLQWKRNKGQQLREQAQKAKKEELKLSKCLDQLERDSMQLNKAKFQRWLEGKKKQRKQEHQHQWETFQAYSKSLAVKQVRDVHDEGFLALRESCFKLNGAKLPKTFDDWNS